MPAKAGTRGGNTALAAPDPRFRGGDENKNTKINSLNRLGRRLQPTRNDTGIITAAALSGQIQPSA